jgi:hypothetical protein
MKVLVYSTPQRELSRLSATTKHRLQQRVENTGGVIVFTDNYQQALREIVDVEILFGLITPELLQNARQLRWIQAPMSSMGTSRGTTIFFPHSKSVMSC